MPSSDPDVVFIAADDFPAGFLGRSSAVLRRGAGTSVSDKLSGIGVGRCGLSLTAAGASPIKKSAGSKSSDAAFFDLAAGLAFSITGAAACSVSRLWAATLSSFESDSEAAVVSLSSACASIDAAALCRALGSAGAEGATRISAESSSTSAPGTMNSVLHLGHFPSDPANWSLIFRRDPQPAQVKLIVISISLRKPADERVFDQRRSDAGVGVRNYGWKYRRAARIGCPRHLHRSRASQHQFGMFTGLPCAMLPMLIHVRRSIFTLMMRTLPSAKQH